MPSQPTPLLPTHIAIIMDGNRRWAKAHKLQALQGHAYVADKIIENIVDACIAKGIPYLTLWAFSTENWKRDTAELEGLMKLFRNAFSRKVEDLHKKGVRLKILGDIDRFPPDIAASAKKWVELSQDNEKITVSFALNYGGRDEILRAVKKACQSGSDLENITEEQFSQFLDTADMPDPDLIIRTGGEQRLSGYLPWQSTYSELYFTPTLMPEFDAAQLDKALEDFQHRQRRFGK